MWAMRYYLHSESTDGTYYLVNGWRKYRKFWTKEFSIKRNTFSSKASALRSYNKLCKSMPEYSDDEIRIGGFLWEV